VIYRFKLIVPLTYKDVEVDSEEVDLSDQEIALIRELVKKSRSKRHGLMPILEDGAPELYDKLWNAIERPLRDTVLEDGRKNWVVDDENEDGGLEMDCVNYICEIPKFLKKEMEKAKFFVDFCFEAGVDNLSGRYQFGIELSDEEYEELYQVWYEHNELNSWATNWDGHEALFQKINDAAVYALDKHLEHDEYYRNPLDVYWELSQETKNAF